MTVYEDFADRQAARFRMFATAVAGERALSAAAGLPPGSLKQWSRADSFRSAMLEDSWREMLIFHGEHLGNARKDFADRGLIRMAHTRLFLSGVAGQIITQSNRQATFGLANPINALHRDAGAIGQLAQKRLADPNFKVKDSAQRTWDADKLVRTETRNFAYQVLIDSQYDLAIREGATEVIIEHPNENHEQAGKALSLMTGDWLKIRDELFHMNSNMTVTHGTVQA